MPHSVLLAPSDGDWWWGRGEAASFLVLVWMLVLLSGNCSISGVGILFLGNSRPGRDC